MKRLGLIGILLAVCVAGCKKEQMTPDGKPASDAKNNLMRIDANAQASYYLSVAEFDPAKGFNVADATFYQLKEGLTTSYECTFKASPGQVVFIEVYSSEGESVSCDIYYKGLKVTAAAQTDIFNSHSTDAPSHANLSYEIPN